VTEVNVHVQDPLALRGGSEMYCLKFGA
jgi:hypothetical protein